MIRASRVAAALVLAAPLAALALAAPASALTMTPNPANFADDLFSFDGGVTLEEVVSGTPAGGVVQDGSVGAGDTTLVFTLSITDGSLDNLTIFTDPGSDIASGAGTVPGAGVDVTLGEIDPVNYEFGSGVAAGETSDRFFVSYPSLPLGTELSFELALGLGVLSTAEVVPEPASAALLGLGLAGLAAGRSRRRRAA